MLLNEALKQIRLFHQKKQVELAFELDISKSYLSEIEANKKTVSLELLEKYSVAFSVPVSSLLLFSENLEAAKRSDKLRLSCAKTIVKTMEWISAKSESEEKAKKQA